MKPNRLRAWPLLVILLLCVVTNPADSEHTVFLRDQFMQTMEDARRRDPALREVWQTAQSMKHYDGEHDYINRWVCSYTVNYDTGELTTFGMIGYVW